MKIEVLYVPDCPRVPGTMTQLREVLSQEAVTAEIQEIIVRNMADAKTLRLFGSPTIRVNGCNVVGEASSASVPRLSCRLDLGDLPTSCTAKDLIRRAVRAAIQWESP